MFVRPRQSPPPAPAGSAGWIDFLVLAGLGAGLGAALAVGQVWSRPAEDLAAIDLAWSALPGYTLLSLARGVVAYLLSLAFTIVYATGAARSPAAEKVMLPVLDILQSIPVLSFMPGFVLALMALTPGSSLGLELACVLAIFTGQVWNMTFSYHASLHAIPSEFREVADLCRVGPFERIFRLELPSGAIGLLWNSMMSMAGGWFFLTLVESFRLGGRAFRLPGLGSYMAEAVAVGDRGAIAAGCVAMVLMIVLVDLLVWRPALVWAERFKLEETGSGERPRSVVYDLVRRSRLPGWIAGLAARLGPGPGATGPGPGLIAAGRLVAGGTLGLAGVGGIWGGLQLVRLLATLAPAAWLSIAAAVGATGLRVLAALALGALWTVPVGIAIGRSPRLTRLASPLIQVAASFPAPLLYPLAAPALLAAGVPPDAVAVLLMGLGTQWYLLFNVVAGTAAVPADLAEVATVFGLAGPRRLVLLDLAGAFPALVTGLVTAAGGAWNASIVAELLPFPGGMLEVRGVGSLIARAFERGDHATLAGATLVLSATLVVVNRLVWRRLYRLADQRFALNR